MKAALFRVIDGIAYAVVGLAALACSGLILWGIWYVIAGSVGYVFSREGKELRYGLAIALPILLAVQWIEWRRRKRARAHRCVVCGIDSVVQLPGGSWCCAYHGR